MNRYWFSFWASDPRSIGGDPPRTFFNTGQGGSHKKPEFSMCVLVEAESEDAVLAMIRDPRFYPEAVPRFCEQVQADYNPNRGGRFPDIHLWQLATPQQQGPQIG